ncbi:MAG: hypothetical protein AAF725_05075 [Acidobacteriota bacterium]
MLLSAGHLSAEQLKRALETQNLMGGRLGTHLLELGFITEVNLIDALARHRGACPVTRADLTDIPRSVLRSIPPKMARRHRVIPYRVRGKTLHIASMDPGDVLREDEISFLTSFMVRTCVGLEFHIRLALRQYFQEPLEPRLRSLARRLAANSRAAGAATSTSTGTAPSESAGPPEVAGPLPLRPAVKPPPAFEIAPEGAIRSAAEKEETGARPRAKREPVAQSEPDAGPAAEPDAGPDVEFIEIDADELALLRTPRAAAASEAEALAPSSPRPAPAQEKPEDPEPDLETRLAEASRALREAEIRDEIGDVLIEFSGAFFRRRALLIARRERIVGWRGAGLGVEEAAIRALDLDARAPSVFAGLRDASSLWLGPLPSLPANRQLLTHLGGKAPQDCLVLPVTLRSKIVCHLYVDNLDAGVAAGPVAAMKRLVAKAGLAFEVYILKNKIRML